MTLTDHRLRGILQIEQRFYPGHDVRKVLLGEGFADLKDVREEEGEEVCIFHLPKFHRHRVPLA